MLTALIRNLPVKDVDKIFFFLSLSYNNGTNLEYKLFGILFIEKKLLLNRIQRLDNN